MSDDHSKAGNDAWAGTTASSKDSHKTMSKPQRSATVPPKWGWPAAENSDQSGESAQRSGGATCTSTMAGPPRPAGASAGGSWLWLPDGFERKKSWRKRHPFLFWGGLLLLFIVIFAWGRMSGEDGPISGPKVAVINVDGMIMDAGDIVNFIEKVSQDKGYLGAIVRINSPGGAVGPSQEIYAAVKRLSVKKPVVASMGALAASGGYYVALGADYIFAGPSTLTASIGVKMQIPNIQRLMETVGISETTLTTGRLKDAGSSTRTMSPEEEEYLRGILQDMFLEFRETVEKERDLSSEQVLEVADGRAMTGRQALRAGLVDELGDFHTAWVWLMRECGITDRAAMAKIRLVEGPEKNQKLLDRLMESVLEIGARQRSSLEQPVFLY